MKEGVVEGENWFSRWEEDLPSPEELMPLSQSLITPHLALAFDIPTATNSINNYSSSAAAAAAAAAPHHHQTPAAAAAAADFDDLNCSGGGGGGGGGDEPARTLKRPRLVWTPQLHKRFVDAVAHLGIKNAVPKTIMQLMSVDGLTRENVASHLQKYRLYLKRMQGLTSSAAASGGGGGATCSPADAATDQLFASAPIPHHFLRGGGGGGGAGPAAPPEPSFMPFVPVAAALQHHQQMVAAAAAAAAVQQQYHQRQMGHFGSPGAGFDHGGFLARGQPPQTGMHRMGPPVPAAASPYADLEEGGRGAGSGGGGGRKVLTLFPTGEED